MKKRKQKLKTDIEASVKPVDGTPETSFEYVNKYGTYEIQPTSDMQGDWPCIAQGLPEDYEKPTIINGEEE
ncbi:MAG: hypothetical protein GX051_09060 [Clostridiales bacterium]|jgi:hypothetical protein|nr:hypothetical protein [Clostridiales bacterium]